MAAQHEVSELAEQAPDASRAVTTAALAKGLILVSCGLYGNVFCLLPPLTAPTRSSSEGSTCSIRRWRRFETP